MSNKPKCGKHFQNFPQRNFSLINNYLDAAYIAKARFFPMFPDNRKSTVLCKGSQASACPADDSCNKTHVSR